MLSLLVLLFLFVQNSSAADDSLARVLFAMPPEKLRPLVETNGDFVLQLALSLFEDDRKKETEFWQMLGGVARSLDGELLNADIAIAGMKLLL